tara:strand:- start:27521 stop:27886 length:366 start_codon:yes stop_codon:yes gene_type:complete
MNATQRKYAVGELEEAMRQARIRLRKKYTTEAKYLTREEKLKALKEGKFTIDEDEFMRSSYYHHSINFNDEQLEKFDNKAFDADYDKLHIAFKKAERELMLGDNDVAMKLLTDFNKLVEKI